MSVFDLALEQTRMLTVSVKRDNHCFTHPAKLKSSSLNYVFSDVSLISFNN